MARWRLYQASGEVGKWGEWGEWRVGEWRVANGEWGEWQEI
ncbi:MAG: hypothetical protein ABIG63_18705 [Chloroflexota bacterium]